MRNITLLDTGWEFSLNDAPFTSVCLPHDWQIAQPVTPDAELGGSQGYYERGGLGRYRLDLELEPQSHKKYVLEFGGVFENCKVSVNDTGVIHPGVNRVLVAVDNTRVPADRWYSGCGIYRPVQLLELPEDAIDEQALAITVSDTTVSVVSPQELEVLLRDREGRNVPLSCEDRHLWSAEDPYLYSLTIRHGEDEVARRIGFRSVTIDPEKGLFINGKLEILKGVCLHQDLGNRGTALSKDLWRQRLELLKKCGCNSIRAAHHMHSEEFMDLCDEMGFYVYEEAFDKWVSGYYGRYFHEDWQRDLYAMVSRDRHRPSVLFWGVGNEVENQGQDSMLEILKALTFHVKALDPSRPVTYAMNPHFKKKVNVDVSRILDIQKYVDEVDEREIEDPEEKLDRIEKIAACCDIICCNYQEQWYEDIHRRIPEKAILGTEVYQYFVGDTRMYQNYNEELPSLVPFRKPYVIGSMIWTGYDYLGESTDYPTRGWTGSLLRTNGYPRPSYYLLKSLWTSEPMVHFSVLDTSVRSEITKEHWAFPPYFHHWEFPGYEGIVIPYMVATNCDRVTADLKGRRYYLPSKNEATGLITGFLPYFPGELVVTGWIGDQEVCREVLRAPGKADHLEVAALREDLEEQYVTVQAIDAEGYPVFKTEGTALITVTGLEILGVDNGDLNLMPAEVAAGPNKMPSGTAEVRSITLPVVTKVEVPLYHGQASVIVHGQAAAGCIEAELKSSVEATGRA